MSLKQEQKDETFNVDEILWKIFCIINAWDEQLLSALKEQNITDIKSLLKMGDSTYTMHQFLSSLDWDKYNQNTTLKGIHTIYIG